MGHARAFNCTKGTTLADRLSLADNFFARLKGLLFTNSLPDGQGLYITPCQAIHMMGMVYAIDCVFVDKAGVVVGLSPQVKPWAISRLYAQAHGCIELPEGKIASTKTELGDRIDIS